MTAISAGAPKKVCRECLHHLTQGNHLCPLRYYVWLATTDAAPATVAARRKSYIGLAASFYQAADNALTPLTAANQGEKYAYPAQRFQHLLVHHGNNIDSFLAAAVARIKGRSDRGEAAAACDAIAAMTACVIVSSFDTARYMRDILVPGLGLVPTLLRTMRLTGDVALPVAAARCLEALCKTNSVPLKEAVFAGEEHQVLVETLTAESTDLQRAVVSSVQMLLTDSPHLVKKFRAAGGFLSLRMLLTAPLGPAPSTAPMYPVVLAGAQSLASALAIPGNADPPSVVEIAGYREEFIGNDGVGSLAALLTTGTPELTAVAVRLLCMLTSSEAGVTALLVRPGAVASVVGAMRALADEAAQSDCLFIIANVARLGGRDGRAAVINAGGLATAASGLDTGAPLALQGHAAELVGELGKDADAADAISASGLAGMLAGLLASRTEDIRAKAVASLVSLSESQAHRADLVRQDCVAKLAHFIVSSDPPQRLARSASTVIQRCLDEAVSVRQVGSGAGALVSALTELACRVVDPQVKQHVLRALAALCGDPRPDLAGLDEAVRNEVGQVNFTCAQQFIRNPTAATMVTPMLRDADAGVRSAALCLCTALVGFNGAAELLARSGAVAGVEQLVEGEASPQVLVVAMAFFTRVWGLLCAPNVPAATRGAHAESAAVVVRAVLKCCQRCGGDHGVLFHAAALLKPISAMPEHAAAIATRVHPLVHILPAGGLPTQYVIDVATIVTAVAQEPATAGQVPQDSIMALVGVLNGLTADETADGIGNNEAAGLNADATMHTLQAVTTLSRAPHHRDLLLRMSGDPAALAFLPRLLASPPAPEGAAAPPPPLLAWALALVDNLTAAGGVGSLAQLTAMVPPLLSIMHRHFDVDTASLDPALAALHEQEYNRAVRVLVTVFHSSPALWDAARGDVRPALAVMAQSLRDGRFDVAASACGTICDARNVESMDFRRHALRADLPAMLAQALALNPATHPAVPQLRLSSAKVVLMLLQANAADLTARLVAGPGVAALVALLSLDPSDPVGRETVVVALRCLSQLNDTGNDAEFWAAVGPSRANLLAALSACMATGDEDSRSVALGTMLKFIRHFEGRFSPAERAHVRRALGACVDLVVSSASTTPNSSSVRDCLECVEAIVAAGDAGSALDTRSGCAAVSLLLSGKVELPPRNAFSTSFSRPNARSKALAFALLDAMMAASAQATAEQLDEVVLTKLVGMVATPTSSTAATPEAAHSTANLLRVFERVCTANRAARAHLFDAGLVPKLERLLCMGRAGVEDEAEAEATPAKAASGGADAPATPSHDEAKAQAGSVADEEGDDGADPDDADNNGDGDGNNDGNDDNDDNNDNDDNDDNDAAGGKSDDGEEGGDDGDGKAAEEEAPPTSVATPKSAAPPSVASDTADVLDLTRRPLLANMAPLTPSATASALGCLQLLLEVLPPRTVVTSDRLAKCVVAALSTPPDGAEAAVAASITLHGVTILRLLADSDVELGGGDAAATGRCRRAGAVRALLPVVLGGATVSRDVTTMAISALRTLCMVPAAARELVQDDHHVGAAVRLCTGGPTAGSGPSVDAARVQLAALFASLVTDDECAARLVGRHRVGEAFTKSLVATLAADDDVGTAPYFAMALAHLSRHPEGRKQVITAFNSTLTQWSFRQCIERTSDPVRLWVAHVWL